MTDTGAEPPLRRDPGPDLAQSLRNLIRDLNRHGSHFEAGGHEVIALAYPLDDGAAAPPQRASVPKHNTFRDERTTR